MPDALAGSVIVLGFGGLVGGPLLGLLVYGLLKLLRQPRAQAWAALVGTLGMLASCGSATSQLGGWAWRQHSEGLLTQGTLLAHRGETLVVSRGLLTERRLPSNRPWVQFADASGATRQFAALGGSLGGVAINGPVPVRYLRSDPSQAIVDDYQHRWAALTIVGGLTLLDGLIGLAQIAGLAWRRTTAAAPPTPSSPRAERLHRVARRMGIASFVLALLVVFSDLLDHIGRSLGLGMATAAAALACLALATWARPGRRGTLVERLGAMLIAAYVLALLAALIWNLGGG